MPKFPDRETILTRDEAINAILTSIAMEETALSHIINAEGEKIQFVLARNCTDLNEVIAVNESVGCLIDKITDLQFLLKAKMKLAKCFLPSHVCSCPPHKPEPPKKCNCCSHENSGGK